MPPALTKSQPPGLPSQPVQACSRMYPGCHSHHTCILGVGGWAEGSRHTGERPALRTESPWRTNNTEAEVTPQAKEPESWVMPDGLCSLAPEASGEMPMPSKTREGKLNKVTFWALRTPASLEQKRLYALGLLSRAHALNPVTGSPKPLKKLHSQLLLYHLSPVLAKIANRPYDSYLSNQAALYLLPEFLPRQSRSRPGALGTIKAFRPSRPAAPAPGKHSPKDLGSTGSSMEALISIFGRKKFKSWVGVCGRWTLENSSREAQEILRNKTVWKSPLKLAWVQAPSPTSGEEMVQRNWDN